MTKPITSEEYVEATKNMSQPMVLEFGADWWPGCRQLGPVVSSVDEQLDHVDFYYVDVDKSQDLAQQFGIQSIPSLILIKDGEEVERSVGFAPEEKVAEFAQS